MFRASTKQLEDTDCSPHGRRRSEEAPFPMCFTEEAYRELERTVGAKAPETGAKGFGPRDLLGFDLIEFDELGSHNASGGVYSPDVVWGAERVKYWMNQTDETMRVWTGDIHSHPGQFGRPSSKAGVALGDLGYVEEVFAQNEWMLWFALPIVTNTGHRRSPMVNCWFIHRCKPDVPMWAEIRICSGVDEFPERKYNPEWEARVARQTMPVDMDLLAKLLGQDPMDIVKSQDGFSLALQFGNHTFQLDLPHSFPVKPPVLEIQQPDGARMPMPFRWRPVSLQCPEARLLLLCQHAAEYISTEF
jgi:hypothetical protein